MESGSLFGEMSLFDGQGRSAQARALEPSKVTAIPYEFVRKGGGADHGHAVGPWRQVFQHGLVGASRERVNKAISAFLRLGWIEQNDREYRILKRREMEIRAN